MLLEQYKVDETIQYYDDLLLGEDIRDVVIYDKYGNLIEEYTNLYQVTSYGRVWSLKNQIWLKQSLNYKGYFSVGLCKNGIKTTYNVHSLVILAFFGPPEHWAQQCKHKDGISQNNKLSNLEYGTAQENQEDRVTHGTSNRGERQGNSILTEEKVKEIRELYGSGKYFHRELADKFGVTREAVTRVLNKVTWGHI